MHEETHTHTHTRTHTHTHINIHANKGTHRSPCVRVTQPPPQPCEPCLYILLPSSWKVRAHHRVRWSLFIPALPPTSFSPSRLSEWVNVVHLSKSRLQDFFASPPFWASLPCRVPFWISNICVHTSQRGVLRCSSARLYVWFACRWEEESMWWDFPQIRPLSWLREPRLSCSIAYYLIAQKFLDVACGNWFARRRARKGETERGRGIGGN